MSVVSDEDGVFEEDEVADDFLGTRLGLDRSVVLRGGECIWGATNPPPRVLSVLLLMSPLEGVLVDDADGVGDVVVGANADVVSGARVFSRLSIFLFN